MGKLLQEHERYLINFLIHATAIHEVVMQLDELFQNPILAYKAETFSKAHVLFVGFVKKQPRALCIRMHSRACF